jgi:eukaryotic-like serine/threonine-protein kinase
MALATTLLSDRYVLDELIGAGGYCEVWRATDTVLTRPVAVKLLHAGYAGHDEALARFKAEARHAGALSHVNIARVYDYGEPDDGQSYLVMELVDGPSLADVLAGGPLPAWRTMDVVAQVAAGLQAAHAAGVIHRDIKPANILFAPGGAARITDFGIAHAVDSAPVTSTGMVMGTPGYIAPERVAGATAGPASDLYALGIVAYECLAGAPPFSGGALEVAIAHRDRPLPPLPASVPAGVVALVMLLTAKDPAWRPASAGEVALQAARLRDGLLSDGDSASPTPVAGPAEAPLTIADDPVRQTPGDAPSRLRVRRPRHRLALAATALAVAALACLVPLSVAGFAPASHRADPASPASSRTAPAASTNHPSSDSPRSDRRSSDRRSRTSPSADRSSPAEDTPSGGVTTQPGQHHHQKDHGHGTGNGNSDRKGDGNSQ